MRRILLLVAGLAAGWLLVPGPVQAQDGRPSARALIVRGRVNLQRGRVSRLLGTFEPLQTGDRVRVPRGAGVTLLVYAPPSKYELREGSEVRITGAGLQRLRGDPPRRAALYRDLSGFRRPLPEGRAAGVVGSALGITLRSPPGEGPRNGLPVGQVPESGPRLTWAGPVAGERLVVRVTDEERGVHRSADLPREAREYRLPEGTLGTGRWYLWTVTAYQRDGTAAGSTGGWIRRATEEERLALQSLEREASAGGGDLSAWLVLAEARRQHGYLAEALDALDQAAARARETARSQIQKTREAWAKEFLPEP